MIDEKLQKSSSKLYFMEDKKWEEIENSEPKEYKYSDCEFIENHTATEPITTTLKFEPKKINKLLLNKLETNENYEFIANNGVKMNGTIKVEYLWKKWIYRKKGKRYKRFLKHSKQVNMIFNGVVIDD